MKPSYSLAGPNFQLQFKLISWYWLNLPPPFSAMAPKIEFCKSTALWVNQTLSEFYASFCGSLLSQALAQALWRLQTSASVSSDGETTTFCLGAVFHMIAWKLILREKSKGHVFPFSLGTSAFHWLLFISWKISFLGCFAFYICFGEKESQVQATQPWPKPKGKQEVLYF